MSDDPISPALPCEDFSSNISPRYAMCIPTRHRDLSFYTSLKTYLSTLHSSTYYHHIVYWSHDDPQGIQDKIRCAFQNLQFDNFFSGLIQFWAPVGGCGRRLLTTSDQPFILGSFCDDENREYRLCSLKYRYFVETMDNVGVEEDVGIITDGAAATAFLNQMPELFPDLKVVNQSNPLLSSALECGMTSCVMFPVFDPTQSYCVGVVEYSMHPFADFLQVFNKLNTALEEVGLKTFDARDRVPYKTIRALEHAKDEIDDALKIIWHTHGLDFAHAWVVYKDDENQVSLEDGQAERVIGLKMTGYCYSVKLDNEDSKGLEYYFRNYHNACYRLPLKKGEGLLGKTFQNYKPYLDEDISLFFFTFNGNCNRFVIYLRSTKTGDLDYVFEFFWSKSRDNIIFLESLLLTFKRYLPSFKFASGKELGEEIDILDVSNSIESENKYTKIFLRKTSLKRGRQSKVEECSTPLEAKGKTAEFVLSGEKIDRV